MKKIVRFVHTQAKYIGVATAALIVGGAAAVAFASIPDGNGTIHGCYDTAKGDLRVIDSATGTCKAKETLLNWSQNGGGTNDGYAHVLYNSDTASYSLDTISSRVKNVVVATNNSNGGAYCIQFNFTPENAHVTPEGGGLTTTHVSIKDTAGWTDTTGSASSACDSVLPSANVYVTVGAPESFFVAVE
jgi:hypothetical protein